MVVVLPATQTDARAGVRMGDATAAGTELQGSSWLARPEGRQVRYRRKGQAGASPTRLLWLCRVRVSLRVGSCCCAALQQGTVVSWYVCSVVPFLDWAVV